MIYYLSVIISFLAAFQLFFLALYLFMHKRGIRRNNSLLGLFFFIFSISLGVITINVSGIDIPTQALSLIDDGFFFLYGPLLYFYIQAVVYRDFKFRFKNLIHLIPYAIHLVYVINILFIIDPVDQNQFYKKLINPADQSKLYGNEYTIWMFILFIYLFCYIWYANRTVSLYRSILKNKFSTLEGINLKWLSFLIRSFFFITIFAMTINMLPPLGSLFLNITSLIVFLGFSFFFVYFVLIKALNQPEIFSGIELSEAKKYTGSNLRNEELEMYSVQLIYILEKDRLFLNSNLTLKELASRLRIAPKSLSQVINQNFNQNFFDFVNSYRCEEVKNILKGKDDKITILEAMYQAGFNSKSSFNKEFKKITGQTPTEFKKSLNRVCP